jgi:hypothetical protein
MKQSRGPTQAGRRKQAVKQEIREQELASPAEEIYAFKGDLSAPAGIVSVPHTSSRTSSEDGSDDFDGETFFFPLKIINLLLFL